MTIDGSRTKTITLVSIQLIYQPPESNLKLANIAR